jgi:hypothetical protein
MQKTQLCVQLHSILDARSNQCKQCQSDDQFGQAELSHERSQIHAAEEIGVLLSDHAADWRDGKFRIDRKGTSHLRAAQLGCTEPRRVMSNSSCRARARHTRDKSSLHCSIASDARAIRDIVRVEFIRRQLRSQSPGGVDGQQLPAREGSRMQRCCS